MVQILSFSYAVLPENGEDCFGLVGKALLSAACVADGCGGLGSRRYPALDNRTGAYAAARLAVHVFKKWVDEYSSIPSDEAVKSLEEKLEQTFQRTAAEKCAVEGIRIVGSMQRRLPTTFCAALMGEEDVCFLWAGDSRGYVLDADGLHQCTGDHLKGVADPFENLYLDRPLSRYLSADTEMKLDISRIKLLRKPCAVILATDGVYGALPTPMEMEMLLWDTLKGASDWNGWKQKLKKVVAHNAQDDATLVVIPCGTNDFAVFTQALLPRRDALQKQFITPVRRKKGNMDFARERWQSYRENYDWTEEEHNG